MGEVMVTQDDRILFSFLLGWDVTDNRQRILDGHFDQHVKMQKIARHRQAAEKATRESVAQMVDDWDVCPPDPIDAAVMSVMAVKLATAIRSQNDG